MSNSGVALLFLGLAFFVMYKFVVPRLFPGVVHRTGVIQLDKSTNTLFTFEASGMPIANNYNRSHVKAKTRRRNHQYEAAVV
ncbi:hypothetical protein LSCM1_07305 [Leishmania martiniquensis]|uniref:Uncharacterized protein n=1 Tax=Leishmania martiniquensis TaxID=1580590 RepID=A0A836KX60_9TRYP|nr:hypothetical protein LSCM1_07305 [Leishmania martiniquensis]